MLLCLFFFFKQKTAYEMRISDWSSDVCSSDLGRLAYLADPGAFDADSLVGDQLAEVADGDMVDVRRLVPGDGQQARHRHPAVPQQIGRASCRERVCQYV